MHGAPARLARADRRLGRVQAREPAVPGDVVLGRVLPDERAALVRVLVREQDVEPDLRVAVERVAVGERELRALRDDVDELGLGELGEVEALEQRELLQADRPRRPRARSCTR